MRTLRIGLHSLILAMANIGCIVIAYAIYYLLKPANQIAVQAPVAATLSITTFAVWSLLIQRLAFQLPVNLLAVLATCKLTGRSKAVEATPSSSLNLRS